MIANTCNKHVASEVHSNEVVLEVIGYDTADEFDLGANALELSGLDLECIQQPHPSLPLCPSAGLSSKGTKPPFTSQYLSERQAQDLFRIVFGTCPDADDVGRWRRSAFSFVGTDNESRSAALPTLPCPWGLRQQEGGPCGVLAAVQAFILQELIWAPQHKSWRMHLLGKDLPSSRSEASTATGADSNSETDSVSCSTCQCGTTTLHPVPLEATKDAKVLANLLAERFCQANSTELLTVAVVQILENALQGSDLIWADVLDDSIKVYKFSQALSLAEWLVAEQKLISGESPVLSFVFSVILSRGTDHVQQDLDDVLVPLIGMHGHCSQELTNLCLTGRAVSNVFDGDVSLGDDQDTDCIRLHGICSRPDVGFLSTLEPLQLCSVGEYLKSPKYPLWIIGSSTHYTLLIAGSHQLNQDGVPAVDKKGESKITKKSTHHCQMAFLHFNGKDVGPDTPVLAPVHVQIPCAAPLQYRPSSLPGGEDDPAIFAEMIRSRWPGAEVSCPSISSQVQRQRGCQATRAPRIH